MKPLSHYLRLVPLVGLGAFIAVPLLLPFENSFAPLISVAWIAFWFVVAFFLVQRIEPHRIAPTVLGGRKGEILSEILTWFAFAISANEAVRWIVTGETQTVFKFTIAVFCGLGLYYLYKELRGPDSTPK